MKSVSPDVVKVLIDGGANIKAKDKYGLTSLQYADRNSMLRSLMEEAASRSNYIHQPASESQRG